MNVSADPLQRVDLSGANEHKLDFSYSVRWLRTEVPFAERMSRYAQYSFLPQPESAGSPLSPRYSLQSLPPRHSLHRGGERCRGRVARLTSASLRGAGDARLSRPYSHSCASGRCPSTAQATVV